MKAAAILRSTIGRGRVWRARVRDTIASRGVACVFAEPQFDPDAIRSLAGDVDVEVGVLDARGAGLEPGPTLYGEMLKQSAEAVASCLASTS